MSESKHVVGPRAGPARRSPQVRFASRSAVLSIATVLVWYFALLTPMLTALRPPVEWLWNIALGTSPELPIKVAPDGGWSAPVPLPGGQLPPWIAQYIPPGAANPRAVSIGVKITRQSLSFFTLPLPLFWAIVLAAPGGRRAWREMALGSLALALLAPLLCTVDLGCLAAPYLWKPGSRVGLLFETGWYLPILVAPYLAPLAVALALLPKLRALVFPWEEGRGSACTGRNAATGQESPPAPRRS